MTGAGRAEPTSPDSLVARMRTDLTAALKARDRPAIAALRTALAAIANAEAPPIDAGPVSLNGATADIPRLTLSAHDVRRIVHHEIADRRDTIAVMVAAGQTAAADDLRAEARILERYEPGAAGQSSSSSSSLPS